MDIKTRRTRRGGVVQVILAITALGGLTWAGISALPSGKGSNAKRFDPPGRFEMEVAFGRIGLDPWSMAAANLSAEQVGVFAAEAAQFLRSNIESYRQADAEASAASQTCTQLVRLITSGTSTEQDRAALATAQASLAAANTARQSILSAAYQAGAATVAPQSGEVLNAFRANHVTWDLPIQYLGDPRSEPDWVALRDAVANDRISTQLGQEPDPTSHQLLLTAAATSNASAANVNLTQIEAIRSAWNTALGP